MKSQDKETRLHKVMICVLLVVQLLLVAGYLYHQKHYWSGDTLRVVHLEGDWVMADLSPYGPGFEKELVDYFIARHGLRSEWTRVDSFARGMDKVGSGRADLFIAGPHALDEEWEGVVRGPEYLSSRLLMAHNQWRYPLRSMDELCSVQVVVPDRLVFSRKISGLEQELECSIDLVKVEDPGQAFFDLLSNREFRFGLLDELSFDIWHGFFPEVLKTYAFESGYGHAWIWGTRFSDLDSLLTDFWNEMIHDPFLAELKDRYFGFFPPEQDSYQLRHFIRTIESRLPLYQDAIIEAALEYGIDPLLLTALIYQESHFDPRAESRTGVRGLVQMTTDTADFLGINNRLDPEESIMGAAMYLDFLLKRVDEAGADSWDRWFLTLAAYNQGLGHLFDAMELARRKEQNSLSWAQVKEVYPLLSYTRYYQTLPRGYARGFEAVQFVENIRYYYYLLHSMISLSRPEVEHLGRFADFVPGNWPD